MADKEVRPNIRIEITNNLAESMEVDNDEKSALTEEGEILDKTEVEETVPSNTDKRNDAYTVGHRIWANINGGFTTGVNIFDKQEQEKLQERAKRFALKPDEINNFTDHDLQQLHDSLGINEENVKELRFEAIHMRGTDEMNTGDILEYFRKYGPSFIEWIDDSSCNVVWMDTISAARALHYVSKPIKNLPIRGPCDPFVKDFLTEEPQEKEEGKSVLLRNANREVKMQEDEDEKELKDAVDVSEISCPIPPGFWRLGSEHLKSKYILLRFALKTDKKPYKAEKFSEYYKKHGNPNYGGLKGIISESCKQKFKGIFTRNRELLNSQKPSESDVKNPWRDLAESWDKDAQFREREYRNPDFVPNEEKQSELRNTLMERLGFKRGHTSDKEEEPKEELPKKKPKMPRMRMYADEEEQKIKRKKMLKAQIKSEEPQIAPRKDLRDLIGAVPSVTRQKTLAMIEERPEDVLLDLAAKLRNRRIAPILPEHIQVVRENDYAREKHRSKLRSASPLRRHRSSRADSYEEDTAVGGKPRSKVAVVVRTQKKPAVASTIWSRINESERLKTVSEGKLRRSSSSSSSSESSSSESSSESEEEEIPKRRTRPISRPGFNHHLKSSLMDKVTDHRSPLKIEISNDHFKRE